MTIIVNLSTTHDYSIQETIYKFVKLCNKYSEGCLQCMPGFFQTPMNYAWVMAKYQLHYKSLIEPYRLGQITSDEFLDKLAKIFYFLHDVPGREYLLGQAWNASIKLSDDTRTRFSQLLEWAEHEPVYLISNTNELNVEAILSLFKSQNQELTFKKKIDISVQDSKTPVEILPNVFLCLSYRYKTFKTDHLLEQLIQNQDLADITLVSQYEGDLDKAEQLGIRNIRTPEQFYAVQNLYALHENY